MRSMQATETVASVDLFFGGRTTQKAASYVNEGGHIRF